MKWKQKSLTNQVHPQLPWITSSMVGVLLAGLVCASLPISAKATGVGSGCNGGFLLGGTAQHARDPENPANEVIRISTLDAPLFGTVSRTLNVKIATLDNQLEFKAYFVPPKTCVGGSPRMQLAIDLNGDGVRMATPLGTSGPSPSEAGVSRACGSTRI